MEWMNKSALLTMIYDSKSVKMLHEIAESSDQAIICLTWSLPN